MSTHARNLPTEHVPLPDPPSPPPDLPALWQEMTAARKADWDAQDLWAALEADPATTLDEWTRCWDRAALCAAERFRTVQAWRIAQRRRGAGLED